MPIPPGSSGLIREVFIQDSSSTVGAGLAGLLYNTASLTCYYKRTNGVASVAITLADATLGTWTSGGFKEVDATNMKGVYEFGVPDACLAAGATEVAITFQGATNMAPVTLGLDITAADPTAAAIATAVWQDATSGDFTVSGSIGKSLFTSGVVPGASGGLPKVGTAPYPATGTLAAAVWDEINTGSTHNLNNSTGKQLRTLAINTGVIYGPATAPSQAGMTSTQFTMDAGASSSNQVYQWAILNIISGTGAGQSAVITNYVGASRLATIDSPWVVQPDNTSVFDVTPTAQVQVISYLAGQDPATLVWTAATRTLTSLPNVTVGGYAVGQDPATLVLDTTASSHNTAGTIGAAINATAAIGDPWSISLPGAYGAGTAGYILGTNLDATVSTRLATASYTAPPAASAIATAIWQDATAGDFTVSGSIGKSLFTGGAVPGASGGLFIAGTNAATTITGALTTTFTGNLTGTVGGMTAAGLAMFFTVDTTKVFGDAIAGSVVKETAQGTGVDPWSTPVPGAYAFGTAGYILGNRLDVSVSSRSTYAGTDTPGTVTLLSRIGSQITINSGAVAIDWGNVLNPTSTVNLSNTRISTGQVIASVTGAVGSVTGSIGGLTAPALAQFFTVNSGTTYASAVAGSVVKEIATNAGGGTGSLTAADVWAYATRTLTALPSIPDNWITAAGIAAGALNGKGDWSTYAGGDTSGTTTLLSRIGSAITIVSGGVSVNLAQAVPTSNTAQTVGDALNAARVQGFGKWILDPIAKTLSLYAPDNVTVVKTFNLDSGTAPLQRT